MNSYAPPTGMLCGNKRPFSATQTPMLHPMGVDGVTSADPTQQKRSPLLCGYPSKKCWSWRVEKRNGELHKFCEYHRQKANTNQRRMEQRRKLNRAPTKGDDSTVEDTTTTNDVSKDSITTSPAPSTPTKCPPTINTAMANAEKAAATRSKKSGSSSYDCSAASSSPRGIDHFDTVVALPSASFTWAEVDLDIGMDAAVEYMMIDQNAIDAEPSDKPVDLYEEDLYFLEHFIMEITTSGI
uniref:Uncharacterized protein n=1 Tax=Globisporangium ultimum (strain ATCC 200006 / CBS 805.95 / DAOM BR144) TaxID=431595 RepID=K3W5F6_GLOUD